MSKTLGFNYNLELELNEQKQTFRGDEARFQIIVISTESRMTSFCDTYYFLRIILLDIRF